MAKKKSVKEIVHEQLPGFRVATPTAAREADATAQVDAASSSLDALKRKYLGQHAGLDEAVYGAADGNDDNSNDDIEIVAVEPVNPASDEETPSRPKTVVVSKKAGKIIGEQG